MIYFYRNAISIIILMAIVLHLFWAVAISIDVASLSATGLHSIYLFIHPPSLTIAALVFASVCAWITIFTHRPWLSLLLIPQQILLMMSAAGAFEAMWLGQFADGVLRHHAFVASDQIGSILLAIGHTIAVITHVKRVLDGNED